MRSTFLQPPDSLSAHKPLIWAGHLYFITFLVFATVLYLERTLLADPVSQIFELINTKNYVIFTGRYTMVLPTTLPLIAVWLGLPVKVIHLLYSISIPLISWIVYCIVVYRFKNIAAGILICCTLSVTTHTFYHSISETTQLIVYGALFAAWLDYWIRHEFAPVFGGVALTILFTAILLFIHPVAVFVWAFTIGYFTIKYRLYKHRFLYWNVGIFLLIIFIKILLTGSGSHDAGFIPGEEELLYQIQHLGSNFPLQFFKNAFLTHYLILLVFLAFNILKYSLKREWLMLVFQVFFIAATFVISLIIYHKPDGYFAMERVFLPFLFFVGYPFFRDVFVQPSGKAVIYFKALIILAVAAVGFKRIGSVSEIYRDRLDEIKYLAGFANSLEGQKFYVNQENADFSRLPIPYNVASETLLYSTMLDSLKTVTVYMDQGELAAVESDWNTEHRYLFTNYYLLRDNRDLNPDYFSLEGTYKEMRPGVITGDTIQIASSFEIYDPEKGFATSNSNIFLSSPPPTTEQALDGAASMALVSPEMPYGGNYVIDFNHGILNCEVFTKGNDQSSIVISGENNQPYLRFYPGEIDENGWAKIQATALIRKNTPLKLYLWNPQTDTAYFDNLTIRILQ